MRRLLRLRFALYLLFSLTLASTATAQRLYVDVDATGSGDGSTWTNAFTSLKSALQQAELGLADEIWVAAGTYSPGDSRTDSFVIVDGLTVVGGFAGDEMALEDRDENFHASSPVILEGDWDDDSEDAFGDATANYSVVIFTGDGILDGVIVQGGNDDRTPTLTTADGVGGGVKIDGGFGTSGIVPTIRNSVFRNNASAANGASVGSVNAGYNLVNVLITGSGGAPTPGEVVSAASGRSNFLATAGTGPYPITFRNVTIAGNGGQAFVDAQANESVVLTIENSIVYNNALDLPGGSDTFQETEATFSHLIFETADKFCGTGGVAGGCTSVSDVDPNLRTSDGFYSLQSSSTFAIDEGDNSLVPTGVTLDGAGRQRIQNPTVDLGWLEGTDAVEASTGGGGTADVSVSPASLDFGSVATGATASVELTISNTGDASLNVSEISFDGPNGADFSLKTSDSPPFGVADGASKVVTVEFSPTSAGSKSATLTVFSDDPDESAVEVSLSGAGTSSVGPAISLAPSTLDFGSVGIDATNDLELTVSNTGGATLNVSGILFSGTHQDDFSVAAGSAPFSVEPGENSSVTIRFGPTATGIRTATILISSNDQDDPVANVSMTGTGTEAGEMQPDISVDPTSLEFGSVQLGASRTLQVSVLNTGDAALNVSGMSIGGLSSDSYSIVNSPVPFTVPVGGSESVSVSFNPTSTGSQLAELIIASNDPDEGNLTVDLSGTGATVGSDVPDIFLTKPDLDFGNVVLSNTEMLEIAVVNQGDADLTVSSIDVTGDHPGDFGFTNGSTPFTLASGSRRTLTVSFTPTATGGRSAVLVVESDDPDEGSISIDLTGTSSGSAGPDISVEPTSLVFGLVQPGTSKTLPVTIRNDGGDVLSVSSTTISGTDSNRFRLFGSQSFSLNPGDGRIVSVRFAPIAAGARSATLTIESNDSENSPISIGLSGGTPIGEPDIAANLSVLDFGQVRTGLELMRTVTVRNDGTTALSVSASSITGIDESDFAIALGGAPLSLGAGESSNVTIRFAPSTVGTKTATLNLESDDPDEPTLTVDLSGEGVESTDAELFATPSPVDVGAVKIDQTGTATFTVTNGGSSAVDFTGATITGPDAAAFSISAGGPPFSLAAGGNREVTVLFSPSLAGERTATLGLENNHTGENPLMVPLRGTGTTDDVPGDGRLQFVHNIPDPLADPIDVYLNDTLWLDNINFREASAIEAAPNGSFVLSVAPANSAGAGDAWADFSLNVPAGEELIIVASGVLEPRAFSANPDGRNTFISLQLVTRAATASKSSRIIETPVVHGATDLETIDLVARGDDVIANGLSYGSVSASQFLLPEPYQLDVTRSADPNTILASFLLDLENRDGEALTLILSGFMEPEKNLDGPALSLIAVSSTGDVQVAATSEEARIQFVQNIPDPNIPLVDVYVNDVRVQDDFLFRTATPYRGITSGPVEIAVAPPNSGGPEDAWVSRSVFLQGGTAYVVILEGVLSPRTFERNPDGRLTDLSILVRPEAREAASTRNLVDFFVAHGALDVGTVDMVVPGFGTIVDGTGYGDVSDYVSIIPGIRTVLMTNSTDQTNVLESYTLDLSRREGLSATLLLSGFRQPQFNQNGDRLSLLAVFSDGSVRTMAVATGTDDEGVPDSYELSGNYPNPFNPRTTISYSLPAPMQVGLSVYNALGERVAVLQDGSMPAGVHDIQFDASGLPSGTYYYVLETEAGVLRGAMVLMK